MKIEAEDGTAYAGVPLWIILAENEARDLAESLVMYFAETPRDAGWHDHIGDTLTLAIETASEPLAIRLDLDGESR